MMKLYNISNKNIRNRSVVNIPIRLKFLLNK